MEAFQQFLDAGGMAIIGVAVGACLTYLFAALSRRHQEKREDDTRWYEERLKAYARVPEVLVTGMNAGRRADEELVDSYLVELAAAVGAIRFVGSEEVIDAADRLFVLAGRQMLEMKGDTEPNVQLLGTMLREFETIARKDLGHPLIAKLNAKGDA